MYLSYVLLIMRGCIFEQIRRDHAYGVGTIQGVRRSWVFTGAWRAKQ